MKEIRTAGSIQKEKTVISGYASTFDIYPITKIDGVQYYERISRDAFKGADLSDIVFLQDHTGAVLARTKNGSLKVWTDSKGLRFEADLGKTTKARQALEDIKAGNYQQCSFSFTVASDHYEKETKTRVIDSIARVYDVSAVSFPANPYTSIDDGIKEYFTRAADLDRERLKLKIKIAQIRGKDGF